MNLSNEQIIKSHQLCKLYKNGSFKNIILELKFIKCNFVKCSLNLYSFNLMQYQKRLKHRLNVGTYIIVAFKWLNPEKKKLHIKFICVAYWLR